MHIKKSLPRENYTKINNKIWSMSGLTDGAKVMYGFIASLPNGKTIHDGYISKSLGVSGRTVTNRKQELVEQGLLLMVPLSPRVHDLYIGYPGLSATRVKEIWEKED